MKHNECIELEQMIVEYGYGSHTPWETGISRLTKAVNTIRARNRQPILQTDTIRRYACGKSGYTRGLPASFKWNLNQIRVN